MSKDWHPADVQAALKKRGVPLEKVGPKIGLDRSAGHKALYARPWPRVKIEIATILGLRPEEVWPSLFDSNGNPYPVRRPRHSNASRRRCNVRTGRQNTRMDVA